jgi:hypothetical protein
MKPDLEKFTKISDEIVVLPGKIALDEEVVKELIIKAFSLIKPAKKGDIESLQTIAEIEYYFIRDLQNRVNEIENDLTQKNNILKTAKNTEIEVTDTAIQKEIDNLFASIKQVRKLVSEEMWQKWSVNGIAISARIQARNAKIQRGKTKSSKSSRQERLTYPKDTPADKKRSRDRYFKNLIKENEPDISIVLKNAMELINFTGLYSHEVPNIRIKDVVKSEHYKDLQTNKIQLKFIVDAIQPLSGEYPTGCTKLSVPLSNDAKNVIIDQINFLQDIDKTYLSSLGPQQDLFPLKLSPRPFNRKEKKKDPNKKPRRTPISSQKSKINLFSRLLYKKYGIKGGFDYHLNYEHLRDYGIRRYCSKLEDEGLSLENIIKSVKMFARYNDDEQADLIYDKIKKYTPDEYEIIYQNTINLGDQLQASLSQTSAQNIINSKRPKFITSVNMLFDDHQKAFRQRYKDVLKFKYVCLQMVLDKRVSN